jgi:hypothetical protein
MQKGIFLLAGMAFLQSVALGNVTGKVNFGGTAPKAAPIKMNADPKCAKENAGKTVLNDAVVVNSNKTLANVFVYVKDGVKNAPAGDLSPVTFDQKGCIYKPHVLGLRVNQPVKILNSDPTMHNVHALPKGNAGFNNAMPTQGSVIEKKFAKPETSIRVKCDVHTWMNAFFHVVDHPYFAVTDDKGAFTIKDLPAGEYTLEAIHEKLGAKTAKVNVTATGASQDFSF